MSRLNPNEDIQFIVSIKKSKRRSIWQIKDEDHAKYSIDGLKEIIESTLGNLGLNVNDRNKIYELKFGTKDFEGCLYKLCKEKCGSDYIEYKTEINRLNAISNVIWLPKIIFEEFNDYPENIFISIQESNSNNIVFLKRLK